MTSLSKVLLGFVLVSVSAPAFARAPSEKLIANAVRKVRDRANRTLVTASGVVSYAGTANHGADLRVVAYRHAPGPAFAYLVRRQAPHTVRGDVVNPPSAVVLQKAARNVAAK